MRDWPKAKDDIEAQFQKIDARLGRIEKALNLEEPIQEEAKPAVRPVEAKKEKRPPVRDIEATIGLVWLNRIGLLALFLGVAFFLKYAFDNRWIGELGRVIIGLAAGFGMIAASELTRRKKYEVIAQGFHGGGVAILYLSIFAAFGFYHLIELMPAFLFMGIVTLYCGFWSTRTGWISSAVIGLVGGFITPFLLGPEKISANLLFSYVILLDLGVLFISLYKKWGGLNIGSFFLTHIVYYNWYYSNYKQGGWAVAFAFVTSFFAIFCLLSIMRNLIYRERSDRADVILILSNGIVYFLELYAILKPFAGSLPGLLPITLACIYTGFSYSGLKRCREDKAMVLSYVGLSAIFVTVAVPVQLKYSWVAISWTMEALVLVWLGFRLGYPAIRKIGLIIGGMGLLKIMLFDYPYSAYQYAQNTFFLNERMFSYFVIVVIIFAGARLYAQNRKSIAGGEKAMSTFLVLLANFVILVQLSVEARAYFAHVAYLKASGHPAMVMGKPVSAYAQFFSEYGKLFSARELSLSILWVVYAFIMVAAGMYRRFRAMRIMALVLFGAAIFKIFFMDLSQLDRAYRIISFISLGVVLIIASFFYQKYRNEIRNFTMKD